MKRQKEPLEEDLRRARIIIEFSKKGRGPVRADDGERRELMVLTGQLSTEVDLSAACQSLHVARATLYRRQQPPPAVAAVKAKRRCPRALTEAERTEALALLRSTEFVDRAPATVHSTPDALEDAVNRLTEPLGNVLELKQKAS